MSEGRTEWKSVCVVQVALLAGSLYTAVGLLKLGWITNFLSHSVICGFMTGASVIIALSQVHPVLRLLCIVKLYHKAICIVLFYKLSICLHTFVDLLIYHLGMKASFTCFTCLSCCDVRNTWIACNSQ